LGASTIQWNNIENLDLDLSASKSLPAKCVDGNANDEGEYTLEHQCGISLSMTGLVESTMVTCQTRSVCVTGDSASLNVTDFGKMCNVGHHAATVSEEFSYLNDEVELFSHVVSPFGLDLGFQMASKEECGSFTPTTAKVDGAFKLSGPGIHTNCSIFNAGLTTTLATILGVPKQLVRHTVTKEATSNTNTRMRHLQSRTLETGSDGSEGAVVNADVNYAVILHASVDGTKVVAKANAPDFAKKIGEELYKIVPAIHDYAPPKVTVTKKAVIQTVAPTPAPAPAPAGSIATPAVSEAVLAAKIDALPPPNVANFPPPPTKTATELAAQIAKAPAETKLIAPAGQEVQKKEAKVVAITSSVPGIGACALATGTSTTAVATRGSIEQGFASILTGSTKTNNPSALRAKVAACTDSLGTNAFSRRLQAAGAGAIFTTDIILPPTSGATTALEASIKTRVTVAATSGALGNAIKTQASANGVLTEAMQRAAPEISAADLTISAVTTKSVDVLVIKATADKKADNKADKKKKDLTNFEIAAIVICSMIVVAGVIYGIVMNKKGNTLDGVGGYNDGPAEFNEVEGSLQGVGN